MNQPNKSAMRFVNPIPFVKDIARSRQFYESVLGLKVIEDHGNFVLFNNGFALHEKGALALRIWGEASPLGQRDVLFYFEHEDIGAAYAEIAPHVKLLHGIERQDWGQLVFRFFDPDGYAIEIGAPQDATVEKVKS